MAQFAAAFIDLQQRPQTQTLGGQGQVGLDKFSHAGFEGRDLQFGKGFVTVQFAIHSRAAAEMGFDGVAGKEVLGRGQRQELDGALDGGLGLGVLHADEADPLFAEQGFGQAGAAAVDRGDHDGIVFALVEVAPGGEELQHGGSGLDADLQPIDFDQDVFGCHGVLRNPAIRISWRACFRFWPRGRCRSGGHRTSYPGNR